MPILPIAAQVAGEDPLNAANNAQAPKLDTTNPPGTLFSHLSNAEYRSLPAGDDATAIPITINIGIETIVNSIKPSIKVSAITLDIPIPSNKSKKVTATKPRPKATGIPNANTPIVTTVINKPITAGSIIL
jgi:hypothetical protein